MGEEDSEDLSISTRPTFRPGVFLRVALLSAVLAGALGTVATAARESEPTVLLHGRPKVVFDWSRQRCDASNIPDAAVRAFRGGDGRVQMILAHIKNRRLIGRDFEHLRPDCRVVLASGLSDDPAAYDDREWIASLYTVDGKTIVALVHNEYQGNRHQGRCPSNTYSKCWYNTLTLAVSHDGGRSVYPNARRAAACRQRPVAISSQTVGRLGSSARATSSAIPTTGTTTPSCASSSLGYRFAARA